MIAMTIGIVSEGSMTLTTQTGVLDNSKKSGHNDTIRHSTN